MAVQECMYISGYILVPLALFPCTERYSILTYTTIALFPYKASSCNLEAAISKSYSKEMVTVGSTLSLTDRTDFATRLPAELQEIQAELARMKEDFQSLKQITRPLLVTEYKLSSRILELSQPRKPTRSNSVATIAKWS